MKTSAVIGILAGVFAIIIVAVLGISYVSAYNYGNKMERQLEATWENNQNVLSNYTQKVQEASQVPGMQRDDLKEVITAALEGRYGDDGSQAVFQFIQEQNPQIDSSVYTQIQRIIEAGRTEFQKEQTRLIDVKRSYKTALGSFWKGTWLGVAGYPQKDPDEYRAVVVSGTRKVFEEGTEAGPIKLR